jgi:hypothetical protein
MNESSSILAKFSAYSYEKRLSGEIKEFFSKNFLKRENAIDFIEKSLQSSIMLTLKN